MLEIAREGAANSRMPGFALGVDGRGWLARAEAEWSRANGQNDPAAWQAVVDAFGEGFRYETARSRWRLAEALAEAGDRESAARAVAAGQGSRGRPSGRPAPGGPRPTWAGGPGSAPRTRRPGRADAGRWPA